MLKIVHIPAAILTTPTTPVEKIDTKLKKLILNMEETLLAQTDPEGVGLAANQIGVSASFFIIKPDPDRDTLVFINPQIIKTETGKPHKAVKQKDKPLEGCLSVPHIWAPVERPAKVLVSYQDLTGAHLERWFTDFEAVIIQHEIDHLQGKLFTMRALEQNTPVYEEIDGELKRMKTI